MDVKYIKLFVDNLDALESLSDAQRGKLFTAILRYGRDRVEPELKGAARVLFPMFRAQIDRELFEMAETKKAQSRGGKKSADRRKVLEDTLSYLKCVNTENREQSTENREQNTENREQNTENREQNTENREQNTENREQNTENREPSTENREPSTELVPSGDVHTPSAEKEFGEFRWVRLTEQQYQTLLDEMGKEELERLIQYIDELAQQNGNRNGWQDWMVVLRRAHRDGWCRKKKNQAESEKTYPASYDLDEIDSLISGKRKYTES